MAAQVRNIADFSDHLHRGKPARNARARLYQFPSSRPNVDSSASKDDGAGNSTAGDRLLLGIELVAGLFFLAMWLLWHLHR